MKNIFVVASPGRTGSHIILETLAGAWPNGVDYNSHGAGLLRALPVWLPWNFSEQSPTAWSSAQPLLELAQRQQLVIQTHDMDSINMLDPKQVVLILSLRKDLFAQVMSLLVAGITHEWNGKEYSKKHVVPQKIELGEFYHTLARQKKWITTVDPALYQRVITIYYEDLIANPAEFLAQKLGLEPIVDQHFAVNEKSPYCYKDIVLNWEELHQTYLKTCNQPDPN